MAQRCDYSNLIIPTDYKYVSTVLDYVRSIGEKFGLDEAQISELCVAVNEAVINVIKHAFPKGERATLTVSCERVPLGLKVTVRDRGLPFDFNFESQFQIKMDGIDLMRRNVDECSFYNLGHEGKEVSLIKYYRNQDLSHYHAICDFKPYIAQKRFEGALDISIREMKPSEAIEIARTIFRSYGNSYTLSHVYFPDRVLKLVETGDLFFAVAVISETQEIAGHLAIIASQEQGPIAEIGLGAIKPEFRGHGIFQKLTEYLLNKATADGLLGIYGQAVTNHLFSQKSALKFGFADCALLIGYIPHTESFKGITDKLSQRESLLMQFKFLNPADQVSIYPPIHHVDMILQIYSGLRVEHLRHVAEDGSFTFEGHSHISVRAPGPSGASIITVHKAGADAEAIVKSYMKRLVFEKIEVIYLYVDLTQPSTQYIASRFENFGFFFAGILPGYFPGDALILQFINKVYIDFEKIKFASQFAHRLGNYVRKCYPGTLFRV